jgi:hypothetical protein
MYYGSASDSGVRCERQPHPQQQGGVLIKEIFYANRELFPAGKYYRFIGVSVLGDFDM